jgi:hypothetical protein
MKDVTLGAVELNYLVRGGESFQAHNTLICLFVLHVVEQSSVLLYVALDLRIVLILFIPMLLSFLTPIPVDIEDAGTRQTK